MTPIGHVSRATTTAKPGACADIRADLRARRWLWAPRLAAAAPCRGPFAATRPMPAPPGQRPAFTTPCRRQSSTRRCRLRPLRSEHWRARSRSWRRGRCCCRSSLPAEAAACGCCLRCSRRNSMFRWRVPSSHSWCVSAASARTGRRQLATLGRRWEAARPAACLRHGGTARHQSHQTRPGNPGSRRTKGLGPGLADVLVTNDRAEGALHHRLRPGLALRGDRSPCPLTATSTTTASVAASVVAPPAPPTNSWASRCGTTSRTKWLARAAG